MSHSGEESQMESCLFLSRRSEKEGVELCSASLREDRGDERRRAPRQVFVGGVAEVTATPSGQRLLAGTSELSHSGCFVKTNTPFPVGTTVNLTITYDLKQFNAGGEVVRVLPGKGMSIAFKAISPPNQSILEDWLAQSRPPKT